MAAFQDWGDTGLRAREVSFSPTTGGINGTGTNDNASAGKVGEYVESVVGFTNIPASTNWGEITSISLTAGDWDVRFFAEYANNTATSPQFFDLGASTTSGNSATGLTLGSTYLELGLNSIPTGSNVAPIGSLTLRFSLSATTTVYLKVRGSYTGTAPQAAGRISARRAR